MYRKGATSTGTPRSGGKMSRRPQGSVSATAKPFRRPEGRDHREPVTMTVTWVGRGEPWVQVECRGETYLRPGQMALFELVLWLNGWG